MGNEPSFFFQGWGEPSPRVPEVLEVSKGSSFLSSVHSGYLPPPGRGRSPQPGDGGGGGGRQEPASASGGMVQSDRRRGASETRTVPTARVHHKEQVSITVTVLKVGTATPGPVSQWGEAFLMMELPRRHATSL